MTIVCALVLASGLGIPDLGAASLGQGSATVARPADLAALYYNPAGLASLEGVQAQIDLRAVRHGVTFQRLQADGSNPSGFAPVSNSGAPRLTPLGGVAWHLGPLTLAVGGHPSNGTTGYEYPDPAAYKSFSDNDIARLTPQRYTSIEANSKVWTPVLAVAARPLSWLDVGAGLQLSCAWFSTKQAISAAPISGEYPGFDAILDLQATDLFRPSAVFGASAELPGGFYLGAAFQLPTRFHGTGTISAQLPVAASAIGGALHGNRIEAYVVFPWIARAGLRFSRPAFDVELAGTIEGWSGLREIRIVPQGVEVELAGTRQPLPEIVIRKDLHDAASLRLGGQWHASRWLTVRAGALMESSAVPEERQALDMVHWQRWSLTAGFTAHLGRYDASLGYGRFFQPVRRVRDSQVQQVTAVAAVAPDVVGNGDFESQIDMLAASVNVRF